MSTTIRLEDTKTAKSVSIHVLPCHIAYDGPSNVSQFFKPRIDLQDSSVSTSYLRGRKLCGKTMPLPKNYTGISCSSCLLTKGHVSYPAGASTEKLRSKNYEDLPEDDEEETEFRVWQTKEKFESLTVWEHHVPPEESRDNWIKGLQEWTTMAEVVCPSMDLIDRRYARPDMIPTKMRQVKASHRGTEYLYISDSGQKAGNTCTGTNFAKASITLAA